MYDPGMFLEVLRKYRRFPGDGTTCTLRRMDCPSKRSSEMSDGTFTAKEFYERSNRLRHSLRILRLRLQEPFPTS